MKIVLFIENQRFGGEESGARSEGVYADIGRWFADHLRWAGQLGGRRSAPDGKH